MALAAVLALAAVVVAGRVATSWNAPSPTDPRTQLERSPLSGRAFATLATGAEDEATRLVLHEVAVRRAPRDLLVRAWLAEHHLAGGRPGQALTQLDVIMRLAPAQVRKALVPGIVQLAGEPEFAAALGAHLATGPAWRGEFVNALMGQPGSPAAPSIVATLREHDALDDEDMGRLFDALIRDGQWGAAYGQWASTLDRAPGEPLPMLWNGGFEAPATGRGFDWRVGSAPGSYTEFGPAEGRRGVAAHLVFLGRPVERANLEQALHLPPGRYRISMVVKADDLRAPGNLAWEVTCAGGRSRSIGEPLRGSFGWKPYHVDVDVPITDCSGQWLRLRNLAPAGPARIVSGELWVDDLRLEAVP